MFGDLKAAGGPDQRQLPLRRGRARVPVRQRGPHRAGPRSRVRPADRRGARRRAEARGVRRRSRTAPTRTSPRSARSSTRPRSRPRRPSAIPGRAVRDDLYMLYTGGTTGMPKGVMWRQKDFFLSTIGALMARRRHVRVARGRRSRARRTAARSSAFPIAPLMHGAAQWVALMLMLAGQHARAHVAEEDGPARGLVDGRAREGADDQPRRRRDGASADRGARGARASSYDLSGLFVIGSGGAILSPAVKEKIAELLPNVAIVDCSARPRPGTRARSPAPTTRASRASRWASTRWCSTTTACRSRRARTWSVGSPARATCRSATTRTRRRPRRCSSRSTASGGCIPGDMAMVEEDGSITLLGRGSVSINSGGEKIFPEEVELALKSTPTCSTSSWSACPTSAGASGSPRSSSRAGAPRRPRTSSPRTHGRRSPATRCREEVHLVDEIVRSPSGKADYRWAKAQALGEG